MILNIALAVFLFSMSLLILVGAATMLYIVLEDYGILDDLRDWYEEKKEAQDG